MTNATDFDRAFALQRWVLETSSTRTVDLPWGTAFFHDEYPLKYDANLALLDRPLGDLVGGSGRRRDGGPVCGVPSP